MTSVAVPLLQIGDEDIKFSGTSFAAFGLKQFDFTGRRAMETVEEIGQALHRKVKASLAGRKKSQLLHLTGTDVKDLNEDLVDPGPTNASTDDENKYVNAHFHAKDNVP